MPRSRIIIAWVIFILGIAAILFGGYGLVSHSPWSDSVNSFCTIFGTMMSFSQLFVGFPAPIRLTRGKSTVTPSPVYPPPPSFYHARQYQPSPYQNQNIGQPARAFSPVITMDVRKLYNRSGIFLLLAAGCAFIEGLVDFSSGGPLSITSLVFLQIFAISENILFVFALRGFHMKQAQQAGWPGIVSTIIIAAAYIFVAITLSFTLFLTLNLSYAANFLNAIENLGHIDDIFYVSGFILLAIAIIHARVYPRWTGIIVIMLAVYTTIDAIVPATTADALLIENFVAGITTLFYCIIYIRWSLVLFKK